jgi:SpoVK/Ycf46/Vps4 family AAA+-type ATPase
MDKQTTIILKNQTEGIFMGILYNSVNYTTQQKFELSNTSLKKKKEFHKYLKISQGTYNLDYNSNIITLEYYEKGQPLSVDGVTKIHKEICICGEKGIVEQFIKESEKYYIEEILENKHQDKKINYYIWDDYWENINKKPTRDINTLYFSDNMHLKLLDEIKHFLSVEEEREYREYGIPYKYNILLEGYPGTGKTSLITAIASELNYNIATISFDRDLTDKSLFRSLKNMPPKTILLLEDIDVLFKERKENDNHKSSLSFSGLINGLDGCGSIDKQIIFMTTNYACNLDCALKRPGRVDKIISFDYCSKAQIKIMYDKFIKQRENKFKEFYNEIRSLKITTAMLQSYFFENRKTECLSTNIDKLKTLAISQKYEGNTNLYS